jgi:hypothetical protein
MLTAKACDIHAQQLFERVRHLHSLLIDAVIPYRIVGGVAVYMHVHERGAQARTRAAVHLLFLNEKVRPDYLLAVPSSAPETSTEGILMAAFEDLLHMKLTSYRLKDRVHIQDMDGVGLITAEMESRLPESLLARLAEIRASE